MNFVKLTHDKLSIDEITNQASSPKCGAVSIFVGTTRDNFEDKKVVQLEYEAYDSMAEKVMLELCEDIRKKWPVENIVIYHRLGIVPVCEASVVIAISSEHRGESLAAVQFAINSLKSSVPIWKKEVYDNQSCSEPQWKENKECRPSDSSINNSVQDSLKIENEEVDPNLIQITANPDKVRERIDAFIKRKREQVNKMNLRDFCTQHWESNNTEKMNDSCARVDAVLVPRKDSKSHLRIRRVENAWGPQTRGLDPGTVGYNYFKIKKEKQDEEKKNNPLKLPSISQGVTDRLLNIERHIGILENTPVPSNIYERLKKAEDKILYLEGISPEYFTNLAPKIREVTDDTDDANSGEHLEIHLPKRKKVYSSNELLEKLKQLEQNQK